MKNNLTQSRLKELLRYCPETGVFTWVVPPSNRVFVGCRAGTLHKFGYRQIRVDGEIYKEHRLAWLYVCGEWPAEFLDHVNGARADNRFSNLREATRCQNNQNMRKRKDTGCTLKGASYDPRRKKYRARIQAQHRQVWLGQFESEDEAHAAYRTASERLHGEFSRAA